MCPPGEGMTGLHVRPMLSPPLHGRAKCRLSHPTRSPDAEGEGTGARVFCWGIVESLRHVVDKEWRPAEEFCPHAWTRKTTTSGATPGMFTRPGDSSSVGRWVLLLCLDPPRPPGSLGKIYEAVNAGKMHRRTSHAQDVCCRADWSVLSD